jgi:hypothetical protein
MLKHIVNTFSFLAIIILFPFVLNAYDVPSVQELTSLLKTSASLAQDGNAAQWEKTLSRPYYTSMKAMAISMKDPFLENAVKGYGRYYSAILEPIKFFKSLEYEGAVFLLGEESVGKEKNIL